MVTGSQSIYLNRELKGGKKGELMQHGLGKVSAVSDGRDVGEELEKKIRHRTARVGVIGLGHVGLSLAIDMARVGFQVTGIDIDMSRAESVNAGKSDIVDVPSEILESLVLAGRIKATQSFAAVENLDAVCICVPVPLQKIREPDLSFVIAAVEAIHNHLHTGHLIILESATYPSTTQEVILPILEKTGLQLGQDFFLAYSAMREKNYTNRNIPKVIVGMTPRCTDLATLLYGQVVPVYLPEASTMAMADEMVLLDRGVSTGMLETAAMAGKINGETRAFAVTDVMDALNEKRKSLKGSKILTLGVACKPDTSDIRESSAVKIMRSLHKKGAILYYCDPHVPSLKIDKRTLRSIDMTPEVLQNMDCVLLLTDHSAFNYEMIAGHSFLILDRCNALKDFSAPNVIRF
jgi:UDP-N-acetyl-D-glucosamine dehydrogenase